MTIELTPFSKLNLLNSKTIEDIRLFTERSSNFSIAYVSDYWGPDDINHADKWPYEHFDYHINDYGFRGGEIPTSVDLAAFGCSFTFGTGLSENMLWHKLLAKKLNMSTFNFGQPGRSIHTCVDMFLLLSTHIKISNAVFLLPSLNRVQIAKKEVDSSNIFYLDSSPAYRSPLNESFGINEDYLHRGMPEEEAIKICRNQIYLLDHIAKLRGVNLYMSSWDPNTYYFLYDMDLTHAKVIYPWKSGSLEFANKDKARDSLHPGPLHHEKWFNEIKDSIK
jgi:hypothetical protein